MLLRVIWRVGATITVLMLLYSGLLHLRPYPPPPDLLLYLPDMTCDPPCLMNVQPGVTRMEDAASALAQHPNIAHASREELPLSALWEWEQFASSATALGLSYAYGVTPRGPVYGYNPNEPTNPVYYLRSLSFTIPVPISAADFLLALPPTQRHLLDYHPPHINSTPTNLQIIYEVTCEPDGALAVDIRLREGGAVLAAYAGISENGVCTVDE